jgi:hypothetical protein
MLLTFWPERYSLWSHSAAATPLSARWAERLGEVGLEAAITWPGVALAPRPHPDPLRPGGEGTWKRCSVQISSISAFAALRSDVAKPSVNRS